LFSRKFRKKFQEMAKNFEKFRSCSKAAANFWLAGAHDFSPFGRDSSFEYSSFARTPDS